MRLNGSSLEIRLNRQADGPQALSETRLSMMYLWASSVCKIKTVSMLHWILYVRVLSVLWFPTQILWIPCSFLQAKNRESNFALLQCKTVLIPLCKIINLIPGFFQVS